MTEQDQLQRLKTGRNEDCPCGSKKKYKKCHLEADEKAQSAALAKVNAEAAEKMKAAGDDGGHEQHAHPQDHPHKHEKGGGAAKSHTSMIPNRQVSAPRKTGTA